MPLAVRPFLAVLLAAALFGASTPVAKRLLAGLDPQALAGLLYLGAALAVLPAWGAQPGLRRPPRAQALRLAGAVLVGGVLAPLALLAGLARAPAASVSLWSSLEAPATAVLAWAFFREPLDRRGWAAVAVIAAAGVLLGAEPDGTVGASASLAGALVAGACLGWGVDNALTAGVDAWTPVQVTLVKGLVAGGLNLGVAVARGAPLPGGATLLAALALGGLSYGLSLVLYVGGAQRLGAARAQLVFAAAPLIGCALAWAAGEPVLRLQLVALGLTALGIGLLLGERHAHPHTHAPLTHVHAHSHDDAHHDHALDHDHAGLPPGTTHTHAHAHEAVTHAHAHHPDLHHRHTHAP